MVPIETENGGVREVMSEIESEKNNKVKKGVRVDYLELMKIQGFFGKNKQIPKSSSTPHTNLF